jgi:hypothetical protein
MKKFTILFLFVNILLSSFADNSEDGMQRLYTIRVISFNAIYDVYFTKKSCGYYKYEIDIPGSKVFATYEGRDFYNQCRFDENFTVISESIPSNIWSYENGELVLLKKRYSPVIEKDRVLKKYRLGFGRN